MAGSPDFIPKMRLIGAITNAQTPTITTTANHGYSANEKVMLVVPVTYGMRFNYKTVKIISITGLTTFVIDYDTIATDAFVVPGLVSFTQAHVCPVTEMIDNEAV